jgi:hypothetical protein
MFFEPAIDYMLNIRGRGTKIPMCHQAEQGIRVYAGSPKMLLPYYR